MPSPARPSVNIRIVPGSGADVGGTSEGSTQVESKQLPAGIVMDPPFKLKLTVLLISMSAPYKTLNGPVAEEMAEKALLPVHAPDDNAVPA